MSAITIGSCMSAGQTLGPTVTVINTSASFDNCFRQEAVVNAGHMKMCEWSGLVCLASHSCSTTAPAIAGGGTQIKFVSRCALSNQSSGARTDHSFCFLAGRESDNQFHSSGKRSNASRCKGTCPFDISPRDAPSVP
jgi:hypothetical protein